MATWHDTANVITGILTALFTGLGAWLVWRQQRERITVEWDFTYASTRNELPARLEVRGKVRNHTGATLKVTRIEVRGPVVDLVHSEPNTPKHESWPRTSLPVSRCEPEPGASANFAADAIVDWVEAHRLTTRRASRLFTAFARSVWKLSGSRIVFEHGAALRFRITLGSKTDRGPMRRFHATTHISPEMALRQFEKTTQR